MPSVDTKLPAPSQVTTRYRAMDSVPPRIALDAVEVRYALQRFSKAPTRRASEKTTHPFVPRSYPRIASIGRPRSRHPRRTRRLRSGEHRVEAFRRSLYLGNPFRRPDEERLPVRDPHQTSRWG